MKFHTALILLVAFLATTCLSAQETLEPFNGKDLTGLKLKQPAKSKWVVGKAKADLNVEHKLIVEPGEGELINATEWGGTDICTEAEFGDCHVELEVMVAKGSNSGVYPRTRPRLT